MPVQTHISIPSISLTSKLSDRRAFYRKKNMITKEMVIDLLMLALLTIVPAVLVLVLKWTRSWICSYFFKLITIEDGLRRPHHMVWLFLLFLLLFLKLIHFRAVITSSFLLPLTSTLLLSFNTANPSWSIKEMNFLFTKWLLCVG